MRIINILMSVAPGHANSSYVPPPVVVPTVQPIERNNSVNENIVHYENFEDVMRYMRRGQINRAIMILNSGTINIRENEGELLKYIREGNIDRYETRQVYNSLINGYNYRINKNDPIYIRNNEVINNNELTVDNREVMRERELILRNEEIMETID